MVRFTNLLKRYWGMAVNPLFIWAILLLIIKLSKTHQKAEQCTKDDWLRLTENRRLINAQHVKTRLEEFWLGGVGLKTGQTNNIRNNMNYCHDELIIMLVFVTLKTAPSALTSVFWEYWLSSMNRSCSWSNVAQWSLDELGAIVSVALWFTVLKTFLGIT